MPRATRNVGLYLLIVIVALSLMNYFAAEPEEIEEINYSAFLEKVEGGEVDRVVIRNGHIEGEYVTGEQFTTYNPDDGQLVERLDAAGVDYTGEEPAGTPWYANVLPMMLPILILAGVLIFFLRQSQGGGSQVMQFGKSKAKQYAAEERTGVNFDDVAGSDEAKEELQEVVEFLKEPKKFVELGARIPKGVLLVGPPGTGKTLLAKAVAGEADVPFFSISGSDFVEMFVGVGASRVRDLFDQAKKSAPCLVFMDELDAVGRQRGAGLGGGHDEREQTLNQLLVEMDGFGVNEGVIILAATNRPDVLDPALLRPGRFDRQVTIDQPDIKGREAILRVHLRDKPMDNSVEVEALARSTPGFTGADLANMVNEGALLAARRNKRRIGMPEMEEAMERTIAGPERKSRVISERERRLVAVHESGHALVGLLLPNADPVHKVSIIPRGQAGGYTLSLPQEDRYYITRTELLERITQLLSGQAAEDLVLGEVSTGAQNDLERATQLVRKMIMEYGMSERLGPLTFGSRQEQVFLGRDIARDRNYSEEIASAIDQEVRRFIDECYHKAERLLHENRENLDLLTETLLKKETLHSDEIAQLLEKGTIEDGPPDAEAGASSGEERPERPAPREERRPWPGKPQEGLS